MKRLLVTGATGFIGRHCVDSLSKGASYEIHALSRNQTRGPSANVHWHNADLTDFERVANLLGEIQPSHLLHFAWYAAPGKYWTSIENIHMVQASLALLNNFVRHGGKRVVMAGSCAEYDWRHGYCSESITPYRPASLYGTCKHALASMLRAFSKETGLSSAWGHIFFLYGPREHPSRLVPSVIGSLLQSKVAQCSHGNQIRDFLYVKDVADAFIALLESEVEGNVNMASGIPVRIGDVVMKIADSLNRQDLVGLGALAAPADEPALLVGDNTRLSAEVGWHPRYSLDDALEETIAWWRDGIATERRTGL